MNAILSPKKIQVIEELYNQSDNFRDAVEKALLRETNEAQKQVERLASVVAYSDNKSSKPRSVKRKRSKSVKNSTIEVNNTKFTHIAAVLQVLESSDEEGLSSRDINNAIEKLQVDGYEPPDFKTLLTVLHGMRGRNLIRAKGQRPHLRYIKSK